VQPVPPQPGYAAQPQPAAGQPNQIVMPDGRVFVQVPAAPPAPPSPTAHRGFDMQMPPQPTGGAAPAKTGRTNSNTLTNPDATEGGKWVFPGR
jgi:hypothetical protein